jgi:hypothetical protein
VGLDVNQSIQWRKSGNHKSLLYTLIDEHLNVKHTTEKMRILLEAGVAVNGRMWCREYDDDCDIVLDCDDDMGV